MARQLLVLVVVALFHASCAHKPLMPRKSVFDAFASLPSDPVGERTKVFKLYSGSSMRRTGVNLAFDRVDEDGLIHGICTSDATTTSYMGQTVGLRPSTSRCVARVSGDHLYIMFALVKELAGYHVGGMDMNYPERTRDGDGLPGLAVAQMIVDGRSLRCVRTFTSQDGVVGSKIGWSSGCNSYISSAWDAMPSMLATVDDVIYPPSAVVDTPGGAKRGSGGASGGAGGADDELTEKLTRLKALRRKGLISAKEYERKKRQLLDDM